MRWRKNLVLNLKCQACCPCEEHLSQSVMKRMNVSRIPNKRRILAVVDGLCAWWYVINYKIHSCSFSALFFPAVYLGFINLALSLKNELLVLNMDKMMKQTLKYEREQFLLVICYPRGLFWAFSVERGSCLLSLHSCNFCAKISWKPLIDIIIKITITIKQIGLKSTEAHC